jgi:hypothetical protein
VPGSDPPFDDLVSEQFSPQLIDHTIGLYPRLGFKKAFTEALAEVARKKPHTAIGTGLADIGRRLVPGLDIPERMRHSARGAIRELTHEQPGRAALATARSHFRSLVHGGFRLDAGFVAAAKTRNGRGGFRLLENTTIACRQRLDRRP